MNTPKNSDAFLGCLSPIAQKNLNQFRSKTHKVWQAWCFFKSLKKSFGKPMAIHVHVASTLYPIAILAKWYFKVPILVTEHWTGYRSFGFKQMSWLGEKTLRYFFKNCSRILVVSEALKQDLLHLGLGNKDRLQILPNPISLHPSQLKLHKGSEADHVINIISVGDFNERNKNYLGMMRTLNRVLKTRQNILWHIVGDGPDAAAFKEKLITTDLFNKVHFYGRLPQIDVHALLPQADFLLNFSRYETFAMAPAEAIKSGIPVIASKSGGPEYYINAQNGILVENENENDLYQAILKMLNNHTQYPKNELIDSLDTRFTPEYFIKTMQQVYNGL